MFNNLTKTNLKYEFNLKIEKNAGKNLIIVQKKLRFYYRKNLLKKKNWCCRKM